MEPASLHKAALIVLGAAAVIIPLFHRLRVSSVLGFMLVGMAVGPFGFGALTEHYSWLTAVTIDTPHAIQPVADLGVTLLLFMIGLELSFERLWLMRRLVFGLGALQVTVSASVLTGTGVLLGLSATSAIVVGISLAMSSTAVVLQVLSEEKRLHTPAGRGSIVSIVHDLALRWPLIGRPVADRIIGPAFVEPIAGATLRTIKRLVEQPPPDGAAGRSAHLEV